MRILIVHNILWAHYKSSVFQALQQLTDHQPDTSLKVLQIARNEKSRAKLEIAPADGHTPSYTYNYELLFDRFVEEVTLPERIRALLGRTQAFQPDVLVLTGYYDLAQVFLLGWAKWKGIRVIMQNESTAADHERGGWKEHIKRWIFRQCDGFFCFGTQSANYLIQLGVSAEKILLRKNAVDNNTLQIAYERALVKRSQEQNRLGLRPNNFVFVGRFIAFKNLPALLSAFSEALTQSSESAKWGLILLGEGPDHDSLNKQINTLHLADQVKLIPSRPWYQVPDVLALSDVLVLPSVSEPWGLVVNEAMACGLPVIVSDRCGCASDLVREGENGFVFDPQNQHQLTALLLRFMNGKVDQTNMQEASKKIIAPYSPQAVASDMLDGIRKIMLT
ncbi:glycosyltransferase [Spirosoma radiotolerans]|uniref:Glycosyl transferase family 1 n=1 Tax=Spirosoma radiotolerans TaxID=1379870 RepID=A0A0E3V8P0_9BACT|nr:glycosyltransferase [Spirosoma radiotolerans]AKD56927.1 glycosyl transferase family 1 [Spirosoma radiotolerans]